MIAPTSGSHIGGAAAKSRSEERRREVSDVDKQIFESVMPAWSALFQLYDHRICYGGAAVLGMLSGVERYMAYEQGTIRSIPFDGTALGRMTKVA